MNWQFWLVRLGALVLAALGGALVAWKPLVFGTVLLLAVCVGLPVFWKLRSLRLLAMALLVLFAIHFSYLMRHTWFDLEYVPVFKYVRVPFLLILPVMTVLGGLPIIMRSAVRTPALIATTYCVWVVAIGPWGLNPMQTTVYASWLLILVCSVSLTVALSDDPRELWGSFLRGLMLITGLACLGSLLLVVGGFEIARSDRWSGADLLRGYRGLFWNPNVMGGQGVVALSSYLAYQRLCPERSPRLGLVIVPLAVGVVIASASRACFLGLIIGGGVYLVSVGGAGLLRKRVLLAGFAVMLLAAVIGMTDLATTPLERLRGTASAVESGSEGRVHIWLTYIRRTIDHPIVGAGFFNSALSGDYIALRSAPRAQSPHSVIVQYMVGPGVPAGLIFGALLYRAVRRIRSWRVDPMHGSLLIFAVILSPIFLGNTVTGPRDWGAILLWFPLMLAASLPLEPERALESSRALAPGPPPLEQV